MIPDKRDARLDSMSLEKSTPRPIGRRKALVRRLEGIMHTGAAVVVPKFNLVALAFAASIRNAEGPMDAA